MPLELDAAMVCPPKLRQQILRRDKYRCRYCLELVTNEAANIDHVKPFQDGGRTIARNLVTSCHSCNKAKGNDTWTPHPLRGQQRRKKVKGLSLK